MWMDWIANDLKFQMNDLHKTGMIFNCIMREEILVPKLQFTILITRSVLIYIYCKVGI